MISFHSWLENAKINRDRSVVQNPNFVHKVNLSKNQHRRKTNFEKSEKEIRKYLKDFLCKFQKCTFMRIPFDSPPELYLRYKKSVKCSPKAQQEVFCNGSFYKFISCTGLNISENTVSGKTAIMNLIHGLLISRLCNSQMDHPTQFFQPHKGKTRA